jgi:hypothetical protein
LGVFESDPQLRCQFLKRVREQQQGQQQAAGGGCSCGC